MATLANLSIGLSADSARLSRDLDRAKKKTKSWSQSMKKMAGGVALAMASIAASLGTRALIQNADALSKNSKALGLNIVAYQRLRFGLGQAGVSQAGFEKGMRKMNTAILDAGDGLKTSTDALDKIGLTYEGLMALSVEERFRAITRGLENLDDAGVRSALSMKLLGKAFADVSINTDQMIKDGQLIAVVNQSAARAAEVFQDAISALSTTLTNIITNQMEPLLNVLSMISDGWRRLVLDFPDVVKWIGRVATAVGVLTVYMMKNPLGRWAFIIGGVVIAVGLLYNKLKLITDATGGFAGAFKLMGKAIGFEFGRMESYAVLMGNKMMIVAHSVKEVWTKVINWIALKIAALVDTIADIPLVGVGDGGNVERTIANNAAATAGNIEGRRKLNQSSADATMRGRMSNPYLENLKDILAPLKDAISDAGVGGTGKAAGGGSKVALKVPKIAVEKEGFETLATTFSDTLKSSLKDAIKTGDFSSVGAMVMDKITSSIISKNVDKAVDFGMKLLGFADGGIVPTTSTSKSYADSVPAMLTPGELVVPKDQVANFMSGSSGGSGQTFSINVQGDVSRQTRAEIAKMIPQIAAGTNNLNRENGIR